MDSDEEWEDDPEGESVGSHTDSDDEASAPRSRFYYQSPLTPMPSLNVCVRAPRQEEGSDVENAPANELDYSDRFLCPDDFVEYEEGADVDMEATKPLKKLQVPPDAVSACAACLLVHACRLVSL